MKTQSRVFATPREIEHEHAGDRIALDSHPWDMLHEINGSMAALTALAGGARLQDLSAAEQGGYTGLMDRLVTLQGELIQAMGPVAAAAEV